MNNSWTSILRCTRIARCKIRKKWFKNKSDSINRRAPSTPNKSQMTKKTTKSYPASAAAPKNCSKTLAPNSKSSLRLRCHRRLGLGRCSSRLKIKPRRTKKSRRIWIPNRRLRKRIILMKSLHRKFSRCFLLCRRALPNSYPVPQLLLVRILQKPKTSRSPLKKSNPSTCNQ